MNENWTKFIELYLQGELSPEDTSKLETELERNPEMQKSLELQRQIHEAAKRSGERQIVKAARKSYHLQRTIRTSVITAIITITIVIIGYFAMQQFKKSAARTKNTEISLEEKYNHLDEKAELENLPISYFEHNGKDSAFMSPKGILLSVPENTFELNGKPYKGKSVIQFQEALDASDIVKAGLSTTSGNRLLETQGMFGLKAFTPEGKSLTINDKDGIYLQVPVAENRPGMMLFNGVKTANGEIDWQNPTPIEKLPVPANMLDLDLFPPGYEAKLDELKWKQGKKQRDSLYLSFENNFRYASPSSMNTSKTGIQLICKEQFGNTVVGSVLAYPELLMVEKMKLTVLFDTKLKGKVVFEGKIADGFHPLKDNKKDYLPMTLDNPMIRVQSKETQFTETNYFKTIYNFELLTSAEIAVMGAINMTRFSRPRIEMPDSPRFGITFFLNINGVRDPIENTSLPPSKVLSIWKKEFDETILATRDFEKRMKAIHGACNEKVFNVYANQINKPLWELDEQVVKMGYPNFQNFADERVGALKQDNAHMNTLRQFYESNISRFRDLAKKDRNFQEALEMAWDNTLNTERSEESKRSDRRANQVYKDEFELNFSNVLNQLGRKKTVGLTVRGSNSFSNRPKIDSKSLTQSNPVMSASNVYNIDQFTRINTANRTSGEFTDKGTGKTAKITYYPFQASIQNAKVYDKLFLYLMPHELTSFQRINPINGKFDYALNNDIEYDMVFIGINENGYFISDRKNIIGTKNFSSNMDIDLKSVSEKEFEHTLEKMSKDRQKTSTKSRDMAAELNWLKLEKQDYAEQKLRQQNAEFRQMMKEIIHPCSMDGVSGGSYYFYSEPEKLDQENRFL